MELVDLSFAAAGRAPTVPKVNAAMSAIAVARVNVLLFSICLLSQMFGPRLSRAQPKLQARCHRRRPHHSHGNVVLQRPQHSAGGGRRRLNKTQPTAGANSAISSECNRSQHVET
jgi:hypothetical protein